MAVLLVADIFALEKWFIGKLSICLAVDSESLWPLVNNGVFESVEI